MTPHPDERRPVSGLRSGYWISPGSTRISTFLSELKKPPSTVNSTRVSLSRPHRLTNVRFPSTSLIWAHGALRTLHPRTRGIDRGVGSDERERARGLVQAWEALAVATREELPSYQDLMYPTLKAVDALGGSAQGREITAQVLDDVGATPQQLELTYEKRPKSVLIDRIDWARSYLTLGGVLERPRRGLYVLTGLGRETLAKPVDEAKKELRRIDREVRARRKATTPTVPADPDGQLPDEGSLLDEDEPELSPWVEVLLSRLHRLSPKGFEEFAIYLLKTFGMELTRVGGSGDEGIDGVGLAP